MSDQIREALSAMNILNNETSTEEEYSDMSVS